jgi:virginiamycin B lyase
VSKPRVFVGDNTRKPIVIAILIIFLLVVSSFSAVAAVQTAKNYTQRSLFASDLIQTPTAPITEFPIPQKLSYPLGLVTDSKGNLWFGEGNTDTIEEFIPNNQTFRAFQIPVNGQFAWVWTPVFDSSGNLWFTTTNGSDILRLDPTNAQFVSFSTGNPNVQPYTLAYNLVTNQLWFTSFASDQFGVFQLTNGSASLLNVYDLPVTGKLQYGTLGAAAIALDTHGNVYVTESYVGEIAKFSQSTGMLEHVWQLPPKGSEPLGIAVDPKTDNIWFTDHATSDFGYINQTSNVVTQFSTSVFYYNGSPEVTLPYWIFISSSGMIWVNEHVGNRIARFDPTNMQLTEFAVPTSNSQPIKLTLDNTRGLVWFSEFSGNKIGMLEQNQSLSPQLVLSKNSFDLSGSSLTFEMNVSSSNVLPLNVSSTASKTGALSSNFSVSTTSSSSSQASVTISRGSNLSPGVYYVTLCTNEYNPVRSCAVASVNVESTGNIYLLIILAVVIVAASLAISIYFVRRWQNRVR